MTALLAAHSRRASRVNKWVRTQLPSHRHLPCCSNFNKWICASSRAYLICFSNWWRMTLIPDKATGLFLQMFATATPQIFADHFVWSKSRRTYHRMNEQTPRFVIKKSDSMCLKRSSWLCCIPEKRIYIFWVFLVTIILINYNVLRFLNISILQIHIKDTLYLHIQYGIQIPMAILMDCLSAPFCRMASSRFWCF